MKILARNQRSSEWVEVESTSYEAEADLQQLIADSPSIIPVEEIVADTSPYVFSVREFGLPGSGSTDVLLFNPSGRIGVIECKLASNSEIKRKVIGQILEYAAFLWNQSYEDLDDKITQLSGKALAEGVAALTRDERWDEEQFRTGVQDILQRGAFNLIIAVDDINEELKRTIDYLNECGSAAFSFHALELHKYKSGGTEMLVPHMYGRVPQARKPASVDRRLWNEQGFFEHARANMDQSALLVSRELLEWSKLNADRMFWGKGKTYGSYTYHYRPDDRTVSVFTVTSLGHLYLNYGYLSDQIGIDKLKQFHEIISAGPEFSEIQLNPKGFPYIDLKNLAKPDDKSMDCLKKAVLHLKQAYKRPCIRRAEHGAGVDRVGPSCSGWGSSMSSGRRVGRRGNSASRWLAEGGTRWLLQKYRLESATCWANTTTGTGTRS